MRLWTIHPCYLDTKGLTALWRESLLAQQVLLGRTRGYTNHPQLIRFKNHSDPVAAITFFLAEIYKEAQRRSFNFNRAKFDLAVEDISQIPVPQGQIEFEMRYLEQKFRMRDPDRLKMIATMAPGLLHPLFKSVPGAVADWEKGSLKDR